MARQRGNRWKGDALFNGNRIRKRFATKEEAEAWEASVGQADLAGLPAAPTQTTLGPFIEEHFEYLWGDDKARDHTYKRCQVVIRKIGADTPLVQLTEQRIAQFVTAEKQEGAANGTINRKLCVLSKVLKLALRLKLIKELPYIQKLREGQGRIRFFTKQEERKISNWFDHMGLDVTYHLVRFLLYTGARRSEGLKLSFRDIEWKASDPVSVTFWDTKSGDARTIPLNALSAEAIKAMAQRQPDAAPTARVFPLPDDTFSGHWDAMRTALGYDEDHQFLIHTLRHTCASRLVQAGVDLRRVQKFMGHKTITTTLRYAHLAPGDLDIAAKALVA